MAVKILHPGRYMGPDLKAVSRQEGEIHHSKAWYEQELVRQGLAEFVLIMPSAAATEAKNAPSLHGLNGETIVGLLRQALGLKTVDEIHAAAEELAPEEPGEEEEGDKPEGTVDVDPDVVSVETAEELAPEEPVEEVEQVVPRRTRNHKRNPFIAS